MSSILCSHGLALATAIVVSSTVLYVAFFRQKNIFSPPHLFENQDSQHINRHIPPSCLSSDDKKRKRKKKKVQFAENVKKQGGNVGDELKEKAKKSTIEVKRSCGDEMNGNQVQEIPENRIALYNGILRDRSHRIECSF